MKNFIFSGIFGFGMPEFLNMLKGLRLLTEQEKKKLDYTALFLSRPNMETVSKFVKQNKVRIEFTITPIRIAKDKNVPEIISKTTDAITQQFVQDVNEEIRSNFRQSLFKEISPKASEIIPRFIARNIVGLEMVKKAVALQMFAKEHIHILLMGDPGTGKTDVLRSASDFAPISSFGLGSGTTGVGLVATVKGNEVLKGLLPMADNGLCCIDELNLMKEESRAGLYNAMEKGFVTYSKGGFHYKFDSRVSVLSTANPKGDRFSGTNVRQLKAQIPVDPALLSRFHLVFFIRKPNSKEFREITKKIISSAKDDINDEESLLIKEYLLHAMEEYKNVEFPQRYEQRVVDYIADLKHREEDYLVEISPRLTIGFMRLCMACARMHHRNQVNEQDLEIVAKVLNNSLNVV
jgi:replicative DNA helicase Mcm